MAAAHLLCAFGNPSISTFVATIPLPLWPLHLSGLGGFEVNRNNNTLIHCIHYHSQITPCTKKSKPYMISARYIRYRDEQRYLYTTILPVSRYQWDTGGKRVLSVTRVVVMNKIHKCTWWTGKTQCWHRYRILWSNGVGLHIRRVVP